MDRTPASVIFSKLAASWQSEEASDRGGVAEDLPIVPDSGGAHFATPENPLWCVRVARPPHRQAAQADGELLVKAQLLSFGVVGGGVVVGRRREKVGCGFGKSGVRE